jgi:lipoprotein-anchoring transpeptidase ErfK/SrfK
MKKTILATAIAATAMISCGNTTLPAENAVAALAEKPTEVAGAVGAAGVAAVKNTKTPTAADIVVEKQLTYNQHTMPDDGFQFDKIRDRLFTLDSLQQGTPKWGVLQNRKNWNGNPPPTKDYTTNEYHAVTDRHGVERRQSAPLYTPGEFGSEAPERYGRDGSLVRLLGHNADSTAWRVESFNAPGEWEVPHKYVKPIATTRFDKVVMVDRTNQHIATLERAGASSGTSAGSAGMSSRWLVRSLNPCTTGAHEPPHAYPTPVGMFVVQDRTPKMMYNNGGPVIVGFAPWASRFTNGAFLHGVPVNNPSGAIVEFSSTLGTIPRSHECVRNASSHAKFIYDWAPLNATLVFVYD